jgi:hypothetical protein
MCEKTPKDELEELVGLGAGYICHATIQNQSWQLQVIADAAQIVRESCGRAWVFVTMEPDGSTVWRSPETGAIATVSVDGSIEADEKSKE